MWAKVDLEDNAKVDKDKGEAKDEAPTLKERRARFCLGCRAALSLGTLICVIFTAAPHGCWDRPW